MTRAVILAIATAAIAATAPFAHADGGDICLTDNADKPIVCIPHGGGH